jgi:hypothetical protein
MLDKFQNSIKIKIILLGIKSSNERRPCQCGLQDSRFVRFLTAKRGALFGPPLEESGGRTKLKAPVI